LGHDWRTQHGVAQPLAQFLQCKHFNIIPTDVLNVSLGQLNVAEVMAGASAAGK
jgi:hypothetical protein